MAWPYTVDKHGRPGMPAFVRRLLREGRAEIFSYRPFAIKLLYADSLSVQLVELYMRADVKHIGVSVRLRDHEYANEQLDSWPSRRNGRAPEPQRQGLSRLHYKLNTLQNTVLYRDGHMCWPCSSPDKPLWMHRLEY